jgi:DNA-binding transcriptional regulator YiaG
MRIAHRKGAVLTPDGRLAVRLPGELSNTLVVAFQPSAAETHEMLRRLRVATGLPVATLAALLGVPKVTVRSWLDGKRAPSGAAKRLIWLLTVEAIDPGKLVEDGSWLEWTRPGQPEVN